MYNINFTKRISESDILSRVNQFEVWWWVIGKTCQEFELICNPLRNDKTPGCWLSWGLIKQGKVVLNDFANPKYHGMDIFYAVKEKFNLSSMEEAIDRINLQFSLGLPNNPIPELSMHQVKLRTTKLAGKFKTHVSFNKRRWKKIDAEYWQPYGITRKQLTRRS